MNRVDIGHIIRFKFFNRNYLIVAFKYIFYPSVTKRIKHPLFCNSYILVYYVQLQRANLNVYFISRFFDELLTFEFIAILDPTMSFNYYDLKFN